MKQAHPSHRSVFRYICEHLEEDTGSARCRQIRKHLNECAACTADLQTIKRIIELYRQYPVPKLSAAARKKLSSIPDAQRAG